ncbi:ABC transporter substrate-binding protein [Chitinasiproducens palmae]|uniref:ABC-type branched-chain amino acid transport system, substrate-binding protein n=1 Tax=Chitinasiproducens palmae TaxID=1770053 RepID=A0A1H2PS98_9BURK|nr:ABC transporter substrate-binding protein [Chitinasiproducens palmae]SDV49019.1 ABC-type branched-chain amino acid transport system, substrate-binding protein [Chitinasiproducens palmae]
MRPIRQASLAARLANIPTGLRAASSAARRRALACAVAAGLTLATGAAHADDGTLTIGALLPMSGPNAEYGQTFGSGADLSIAHVNDDHILSKKLVLRYEDSQALPMQGVLGMNKLVNVYETPLVLTGFTGVSKAVAPIARRSRTVAVNGGGVGPDLAQLGPYFWNVIPLANAEVRAIIPYLINERKLKRFVLIYVDDPLGQSINQELAQDLPPAGGTLAASFAVPAGSQQFGGVVARVRDARPDLIFIASYGAQQSQIVKQLRDNGVMQQIASYSAFSIPAINALPEAKGALYTTQRFDWDAPDRLTQRFVADYKQRYGRKPTAYAANYYNAVRLFAILAASLEHDGKPVTGQNLLAARQRLQHFDLVGGSVSFDANGTVRAPIQVNQIDGAGGTVVSTIR